MLNECATFELLDQLVDAVPEVFVDAVPEVFGKAEG